MLSWGLSAVACYFVGTLYPFYASFKALCTNHTEDDVQWLTYWTVYSALTTAEVAIKTLFFYIPLYYEMKLALLIWLMAPQTQGAKMLYEKFIRPFLIEHASKIDPVFKQAESAIASAPIGQAAELASKYGPAAAHQAIAMAARQLESSQGMRR
jgi:receptor expression-enhancing protein 5/6